MSKLRSPIAAGTGAAVVALVTAVVVTPAAQAASPADDQVYVSQYVDGDVLAVDAADPTDISSVAQITDPGFSIVNATALSPDGSELYVAAGRAVAVVNTTTNTVEAYPVPATSTGPVRADVVFSPDGQTVYSTFTRPSGARGVDVIDATSRSVVDTVGLPDGVQYLAITPDGGTLYVTSNEADGIYAIDTANYAVSFIPLGTQFNAGYPSVSPDGTQLWVPSPGGARVLVIDTASNTVEDIHLVSGNSVALSADGSLAYLSIDRSGGSSDGVLVLDAATGQIVNSMYDPSLASVRDIVVSPDGNSLFMASRAFGGRVFSVDEATLSIQDEVAASNAYNLTVMPPTVPPTEADVAINLSAHEGPVLTSQITYDLDVANQGPGIVDDATVTVDVPAATLSVTGLPAECSYTAADREVACDTGSISSAGAFTATFRANFGLLSIGSLDAIATRTASDPGDPNPGNDTDSADCNALTSLLIDCTGATS